MFYQTSKSHIPADRVAATRRITMADYVTSWHEHEEFMFLLPSQGTLTLTSECSKHSQRIGAGVLAMVPAGIFHDTASNPGEHCHTAIYAERDFVSFCARKSNVRIARGDAPRYCVPPPALLGALRLQTQFDTVDETEEAHDMARYQNDLVDRLIASACVAAVLGAAPSDANPKVSRGQLVSEIKAYLDVMLAERIDIETIASEFAISRRHLTRIFREETGESLTDYQLRQRVMRARSLLNVPGTTVLSAALSVGIESPSYLARLFTKFGLPAPRDLKASRARCN
ncbi:helix-turn-helix transcriptional regulator [Burkholderia cenocepacia]|uniref:helix-turn-helix domain-containing protein n=1 Tax=Burkholderia cepacia complex TaxID=87882 RepID=UPI000F56D250|nr:MULTISPECIES: AraC family transcriptional regulator [Burkholderia cepacia complex]ELW9447370.1 helix-turn-helix transcriptional regulator [Burkholderia cenocepacia]MBR8484488.1 helix-turn-helix transcriptional regulator [Burkholderia cenocepacia]MDN7468630.1 AraC family transcriptional regulator [Burkholderia orbicola]MDN7501295.1 AraC family transcriptional regulator [Burkholderia orbicola]RQU18929.1 AraC family transcriptional regulator [Burkholderia cenocepacia]